MNYEEDRNWSDQYIPACKLAIAPKLTSITSLENDTKHVGDLMVIEAAKLIACRVRRPGYAERYPWQFTLRAWRKSGAKTELEKILEEGFGEWFLYGHAAPTPEPDLCRYFLMDLNAFRAHKESRYWACTGYRFNQDLTTAFQSWDVRLFAPNPPLLLWASHVYRCGDGAIWPPNLAPYAGSMTVEGAHLTAPPLETENGDADPTLFGGA
jgi:hypothetical protein